MLVSSSIIPEGRLIGGDNPDKTRVPTPPDGVPECLAMIGSLIGPGRRLHSSFSKQAGCPRPRFFAHVSNYRQKREEDGAPRPVHVYGPFLLNLNVDLYIFYSIGIILSGVKHHHYPETMRLPPGVPVLRFIDLSCREHLLEDKHLTQTS